MSANVNCVRCGESVIVGTGYNHICRPLESRKVVRCLKCNVEMMPGSYNGLCQTCNGGSVAEAVDPKCGKCGESLLVADGQLGHPHSCKKEAVNHPAHYGGADNPYEAIKVIRAWDLGFSLGNAVKYISRAGRKDPTKTVEDLKKAAWYLAEEIAFLERSSK